MAQSIALYQIYYEDSQKEHIFPFATPYKNTELTEYFENSVIQEVVYMETADKIGVCSWQLKHKLRFYVPPKREFNTETLESNYDVLLLTRNGGGHQMLNRLEGWHPGALQILRDVCDHIGLNCPNEVTHPVYFNHFVAAQDVYNGYVRGFLSPAMAFMHTDAEIRKRLWIDSGYSSLTNKIPQIVKDKWGYYPMHTFVLERLFSVYLEKMRHYINIQQL